ncbi:MAG TPA: SlyX family protein [Gammaproteobacteria bacterium]|jgi:SlyX protein|nr:SlyX family protein [Gammaproteobacteria bacterium]HJP38478.1 SlyX family protein [Gammaproteobacteria bacterium]
MSQEEHLIELESKIAHQDHAIHTLGEEVYRQQKKLDHLETTCNFLIEQLKKNTGTLSPTNPDDEKPPHY